MTFFKEKKMLWFLLAGIGILHFLISFFSEGTNDSGDGIQHYLISRYSWKYPELFLHLWGKPFFTLVSSPFSQFGIKGSHVFNIICAVGSAYLTFCIAKKLEIKNSLLVIPFLIFAPVYFSVVQSGLTEPFFGLILTLCIYLALRKEYIFSSLLISFLPFVRSEGYLILPLFFMVFLMRKRVWAISLLAFGTAVYSVLGYFYYEDLLWLFHQNPYKGAEEIYGSGRIYHFVIRAEFIWGLPLFLLFVSGCAWMLIELSGKEKRPNEFFKEELLLVFGSFLVYFTAHTIFWWQGLFSSLGLIRVMAAVIPVSAIICLRGFNYFSDRLSTGWIKLFSIIVLTGIIFICVFHNRSILRLNEEDAVIKQAADWIKSTNLDNNKIYYLHPYVTLSLDLDPFDRNKTGELWGLNSEKPGEYLRSESIILWESHFSPNEGKIMLEVLLNDSSFELLNKFVPEKEFTVLGGRKFEVYVFRKR